MRPRRRKTTRAVLLAAIWAAIPACSDPGPQTQSVPQEDLVLIGIWENREDGSYLVTERALSGSLPGGPDAAAASTIRIGQTRPNPFLEGRRMIVVFDADLRPTDIIDVETEPRAAALLGEVE